MSFDVEAVYGYFMESCFSYSASDNVSFMRLEFCGWDVLTDEDYLKAKGDQS